MMQPIQFASQSYKARSGSVSLQRLQNLYLEANPQGCLSPVTLYGTPGLRRWVTVGKGPIRGMRAMGPALFIISGDTLYTVRSNRSAQAIGSIASTGNVYLTDNGTHVGIATATLAYAADSETLTPLPQTELVGATYQDGYAIFAERGTERFWVSAIDDLTTLGSLSYSTADAFADSLVGCISDHRELWLFGEETVEIWFNSGGSPFPFTRAQGGFIERGCAASGSIAKARNRVFWLGNDKAVYCAAGYQPEAISTPAIEELISKVADASSAWAFVYHQHGHTFYTISFSDLTLCYDLETGLWHERQSEGLGRWRANCYAECFGLHLVGDYLNGNVYELDLDAYTDDGAPITREAVAPPLSANGERVAMHKLHLDCDVPISTIDGDPKLLLDWTDDGGKTWSNPREARAGTNRVTWNRLGSFRKRSLRITTSSPTRTAILGAYAQLEMQS